MTIKTNKNGGIWFTFSNGWTISIQHGVNSLVDNGFTDEFTPPRYITEKMEIAIINPGGGFHQPNGWDDNVLTDVTADEIVEWMQYVNAQPKESRV